MGSCSRLASIAALLAGAVGGACTPADRPAPPSRPPAGAVLATLDGLEVTLADVQSRTAGGPAALRHAARDRVDRELVRREAARRGLTEAQLLQAEVADKVRAPTPDEIEAAHRQAQAFGGPMAGVSLERFRAGYVATRRARAEAELRQAFLATLRARAHVSLDSAPPELRAVARLERAGTVPRRGEPPSRSDPGARPMPEVDHGARTSRPTFGAPPAGGPPATSEPGSP